MDSMSPGPLFRWTSIAAPIISLLRRSAFSYNGMHSQREFLQKTAKETKVGIGFATFFVIFVFFCWILLSSPTTELLQKIAKETKIGVGFCNLFVIFASFCLLFSAA